MLFRSIGICCFENRVAYARQYLFYCILYAAIGLQSIGYEYERYVKRQCRRIGKNSAVKPVCLAYASAHSHPVDGMTESFLRYRHKKAGAAGPCSVEPPHRSYRKSHNARYPRFMGKEGVYG